MNTLKINGESRAFPEGLPNNVAELLDQLAINQATVVAEIDDTIVKRTEFATTPLKPGQSIELIRFVGGG